MTPLCTLSTGQCATLACLLEVAAPKPGNVHRGADFEDLSFHDFLASAVAIAPAMELAVDRPLGQTVLEAVRATWQIVGTNTNLGTVLLLAPLAKVPRESPLRAGVAEVLHRLAPQDAALVYEAIRLAHPGGLGRVAQHDVADPPPVSLIAAMQLAAGRDLVARQYAEDFAQVFDCVVPWLRESVDVGMPVPEAVVHVHVRLMAAFPDSLIARKCGPAVAAESAARAALVLLAGGPGEADYRQTLADLDFWLRSDGHRRNPGTTADLVAAGLFIAIREAWLPWAAVRTV